MMERATSFLRLRWAHMLLLSLIWATMGSAAAVAERGHFDRASIAAKTPAGIGGAPGDLWSETLGA
jgi:hypothetical protein